ncbi:MAG: methylenetetrahydrofolate--tRNA-(uracil(54)-C(5))-methyltransferase (FADH(2)-oxidizing) TrmFO [Bdellovibrionota bacterium]
MSSLSVNIIGAGLAGSEASYFLAENGIRVMLHEMRPIKTTPAHKTDLCAELVCSNSFKSLANSSPSGMLKREMTLTGSLILRCAGNVSIPGGEALTVDRGLFSKEVTMAINSHPNITFIKSEVTDPSHFESNGDITLIATGPLTSEKLSRWIADEMEYPGLYFFDAIAPIVSADTIDFSKAFMANRYGKGDEDAYVNCPLTEAEYYAFVNLLINGEKIEAKPFETINYFQGCQPIEAIAASGIDSLRFGPMKPTGLLDPKTGKKPYAVLQLRPENKAKTAYNMVGFQTKLKYGEQARVFHAIPGLKDVEFLRYGSMHRNTYVCGPEVLSPDLSMKGHPKIYMAGQITGVEGYLESAACGLLAAIFIHQRLRRFPHNPPPANTAMGTLLRHVTGGNVENYQPSRIHFGLFDHNLFNGVSGAKRDRARALIAEQTIANYESWLKSGAECNSF